MSKLMNLMLLPRKTHLASMLLMVALLASCSSGYQGYMTRSYTVRGHTYHPMSVAAALHFEETGTCSWYDEATFFGLRRGTTSLGEKVMPWDLSGAHKTLPLPCLVKVTNLRNGKSVKVRINDRGPFIPGRHLDLSPRAAKQLDFHGQGLTTTHLEVLAVGDGAYQRSKRRRGFF
ncbi:MAG: septal ring lytic transglycosylase RlpA family protein [Verrucomicrobia bacterium]|nr:septal ring lytic transglycosylase RlpA family protein [Verrucomicrobiota bacterium]